MTTVAVRQVQFALFSYQYLSIHMSALFYSLECNLFVYATTKHIKNIRKKAKNHIFPWIFNNKGYIWAAIFARYLGKTLHTK